MDLNLTAYSYVLGAAALVLGCVTVVAWKKRRTHVGVTLALMAMAAFIWALAGTFEVSAVDMRTRIILAQLGYLGAAPLAPLYLMLALRYGRHLLARCAWILIPAFGMSIATIAVVLTNGTHHLFWASIGPELLPGSGLPLFEPGPWYWLFLVCSGSVTLVGTILLAREAFRTQRLYRAQAVTVLVSVAVPWIGEMVSLLPGNPFPGLNLTVISLAITGALLMFGVLRYRLGDVIPIARDAMLEEMSDAVVVIDSADRVVDVNPAGRRLLGLDPSSIGRNAGDALPSLRGRLPAGDAAVLQVPFELELPGVPGRCFEVRVSPIRAHGAGSMIALRDVTDRARMEQERDRLIAHLRAALADIRTLRGLLPICASCKKIRNDEGYWQNLEQYIVEHSQAEFSHGICPDCLARIYDRDDAAEGTGGTG